MNKLKTNIENYIGKYQKEIDRIEEVTIANPQKVYTNVKLQDRAIILEKVINDLNACLKESEAEDVNISEGKIKELETEIRELLCEVESKYEPVAGHGYIRVDHILSHLYKMCDILGFEKTNRLLIDSNREEISGGIEMNDQEKEIMRYLEESYCGARTMDDESCQIRIARAIAAFKSDPKESPSELFTEKFINKYCIETSYD